MGNLRLFGTYFLYTSLLLAMARSIQKRSLYRLAACWVALAAFLLKFSEPSRLFSDFHKAYYPAARVLFTDPSQLYAVNAADGFVNIPAVALLFLPFSKLDRFASHLLLALLSIACVILIFLWLGRLADVSSQSRMVLLSLIVMNGPLYNSILEGNLTHFVLLILAGAFLCLKHHRRFAAGLLFGVAAVIKMPLMLFSFYFLVRRRGGALLGMAVASAAIIGLSFLVFGPALNALWYERSVRPFSGNVLAAFNVQSLDGFLARLWFPNHLLDWKLLPIGREFEAVRSFLVVLLLAPVFWTLLRAREPQSFEQEALELSVVLSIALLFSPVSWSHYYLVFLIPQAFCVAGTFAFPEGRAWMALRLLVVFLISLPVLKISTEPLRGHPFLSDLVVSHLWIGGLLFTGFLLFFRWQSLAGVRPQADRDLRLVARL